MFGFGPEETAHPETGFFPSVGVSFGYRLSVTHSSMSGPSTVTMQAIVAKNPLAMAGATETV